MGRRHFSPLRGGEFASLRRSKEYPPVPPSDYREVLPPGVKGVRNLKELKKAHLAAGMPPGPVKEVSLAWGASQQHTLESYESRFTGEDSLWQSTSVQHSKSPGDPAKGALEYMRTLHDVNEFLSEEPSGYRKILSDVSSRVRQEYRNNKVTKAHLMPVERARSKESPTRTFISKARSANCLG